MSFLTLEKFVTHNNERYPEQEVLRQDDRSFVLTRHMLAPVSRYALSGEPVCDLAKDLESIGLSLAPGCVPEILPAVAQHLAESEIAQESLHNLETQLRLAQMSANRFQVKRLGREEALAELACESRDQSANGWLYVAIFVAPSLPAIRSRHENDIGDFLLEEVSHKNLSRRIPSGKVFTWSPNSLLVLWRSQDELSQISTLIANGIRTHSKHRAFVGTRTATFSIELKPLVLKGQGDADDFVRDLDSFSEDL